MTRGTVSSLHALLPVVLRPPGQPDLTVEFVIDTGFTGALTLPPRAVAALKLPFVHQTPADLADDSTVDLDVHSARIVWQGAEREVRVLAAGRRPLLGTALLKDARLMVEFEDGGAVLVEPLGRLTP